MATIENKNKIIFGVFWSYSERFLVQLITVIISIILARILTPEDYGLIAIVTVFITICDAFVTGGFGNALVQKKEAKAIDFNSFCWLSLLISILLYFILYIIAPYIGFFYKKDILVALIRVMGLRIIFSAFNSLQQAYVQRKMLFKRFFFATLGGTIFSAVLSIIAVYLKFGVWALVVQSISNVVINTIILFLINDWKPRFEFSYTSIKETWQYSFKIFLSTIIFIFKDNIRQLIIGKQFTSSDLAYYNQGKKFPNLLVSDIVECLGKVLFPVMSKEQENYEKIKKIMQKSIRISSFILNPCIIGFFTLSDTFTKVILTEKWLPCVPFMRIMCLVYITRSMTTIFQKGILAIGNSKINLIHEIVTSILTIIFLFFAAFKLKNIFFIAWSYVIVMLIGLLIYIYYILRIFKYTIFEIINDYIPSFLISVLMGIIVYFVGKINFNNFFILCLQIIIGVIVYILFAIIIKDDSFYFIKSYIKNR